MNQIGWTDANYREMARRDTVVCLMKVIERVSSEKAMPDEAALLPDIAKALADLIR